MGKALRRGLLLLCAVSVLAVPAVANGRQLGDLYRSDDGASRDDRRSLQVVGLTTDGRLVRFDAASPGRTRAIGKVKGLIGDQSLVGVDYRVQDGKLYGVGNAGGIYTLGDDAGATKVGQLTVALSGTSFGVDFNPAANRLRVVSDTGQNLRHNLDDATATAPPLAGMTAQDGTLTVPPATTLRCMGSPAPPTPTTTSTRTPPPPCSTSTRRPTSSSVQSPANAGALAPTGKLLVDAGPVAGFDIYSRGAFGTTQGNHGFAAISVLGRSSFYQVSLLTGRATRIGSFRPSAQVADIAIPLDQG